MSDCPIAPDIQELSSSIKLLVDRIETQTVILRDIVRWLLIVVCVIALGRSALDLGKDFFVRSAVAQAEAGK